jgi:Ni2+-binding GTPase involved in maturation of urease and hydrogenase
VKKPYVIGIAGGTASGKSTLCERLIRELALIIPGRVETVELVPRQPLCISFFQSWMREINANPDLGMATVTVETGQGGP